MTPNRDDRATRRRGKWSSLGGSLQPSNCVHRDPVSGLWLLPRSPDGLSRYFPGWGNLQPALDELLLDVLQQAREEDRASGVRPRERTIRRPLGLLPRPDNDYDERAVAVVSPEPSGGPLDPARQVAWVKGDHLNSLSLTIRALSEVSGGMAGCAGLFNLSPWDEPSDEIGREDDPPDQSRLYASSATAARVFGYTIDGPRGDIATWSVAREAVLSHLEERRPSNVVALVPHRARWLLPKGHPVRETMYALRDVDLNLRATSHTLDAYFATDLVSHLYPSDRDFFDRTHLLVQRLGGSAPAAARAHTGALEVFVEDSRPLTQVGWW